MVESCRSQNNYTGLCHWKWSVKTLYGMDNPLRDISFYGKHDSVITIYIIPPHRHDTGSWNASSCKTMTYLFYIVNIMGVDALATLYIVNIMAADALATYIDYVVLE